MYVLHVLRYLIVFLFYFFQSTQNQQTSLLKDCTLRGWNFTILVEVIILHKKLRPANIFVENCISRFCDLFLSFFFHFVEFIFLANITNWMCTMECLLEVLEILLKFSLETKKIFEDVWKVFTLMEWTSWLKPRQVNYDSTVKI